MDLYMPIMNTSNFTLYSISFILGHRCYLQTFFIPKVFLIEQGIVFNSFLLLFGL